MFMVAFYAYGCQLPFSFKTVYFLRAVECWKVFFILKENGRFSAPKFKEMNSYEQVGEVMDPGAECWVQHFPSVSLRESVFVGCTDTSE